jgi:RHS repeat-associated protein
VIKYHHTDALGSPVAVTDTAAQVIERTQYEPYGAAIGKTVDGVGYTGHVMDGPTGLTYMQQRYYDPGIGRNLSVDPVTAYGSGDYRYFNRYAYAFNNPYRFTDPDGRCPSCVVGAIIGGGLELGFQLLTSDGRASYAAAGSALAHGDLGGAWKAAGTNLLKVGASAGAGAVGAGLAGKIAQAANLASKGMAASTAAKVAVNTAIKVGGNGAAGAGLGAATQGANNIVSGKPVGDGMTGAAIGGGIGGMVGAGAETALRGATQNLADSVGAFIGGSAGVAAPGASSGATVVAERLGATAGGVAERAATPTCKKDSGC